MSVVKQKPNFCIDKINSEAILSSSRLLWSIKGHPSNRYQQKEGCNFVLIEKSNLVPHLLETLTDGHQDWISLLQPSWEVERQSLDRLRLTGHQSTSQTRLTIQDILPLIHKSHYSPVQIAQELLWTYTCCLNIIGLGRVRVFISFTNPDLAGDSIVLVTNRLVSSPKVVLTQWVDFHFSHHSPSTVETRPIEELHFALC